MIDARYSRRRFLAGLGASSALIPLLDIERVRAATAALPRRLIVVLQTNGTIGSAFFPTGEGTDLRSLTLPAITKPLEAWKSELIFFSNLELRNFMDYPGHGAGHENYSMTFTGNKGIAINDGGPRFVGGGPSFDQFVAEGIAAQATLPFRSINLGVQVGSGFSENYQARCFYRAARQALSPENDPARAFASVFAGRQAGPGAAGLFEKIRLERKSILDALGPSIEAFGRRVGTENKAKIDAHLQSVRDLERQLGAGSAPAAACTSPTVPALDPKNIDHYPRLLEAQFDIIVSAMKCDATRVAGLQLANGHGMNIEFPWIGLTGAGMEYSRRNWHDVAHRPGGSSADKIRLDGWLMQQFAALLGRLKAVPEGGGTMLDNTVVLWANHMGNGGAHNSNQLPWIVAGRGGGYLKTGQYIRPSGPITTNGVMHTLINACGVSSKGFGDPKYGGELTAMRA